MYLPAGAKEKNPKRGAGLRGFSFAGLLLFFAVAAPPAALRAATTLYLQDTVAPIDANSRNLTYDRGAAVVTYTKNTVAGAVTPPTATTQFTETAGGAVVTWYTGPLDAVTISGNVVFNIWAAESATQANATITAELLRANSAGSILSTIAVVVTTRTELGTTAAVQNWGKAPASTTLVNGDRLVLRLHIDDGNTVTMSSGRTVTARVGGATAGVSGDSWVKLTENLAPASPAASAITGVAGRQLSASWPLISGATGYVLGASVNPANPPAPVYASSVTLVDTAATVDTPALNPNTTYYLFVRSNGYGNSSSWTAYPGTSTLLAYPPAFSDFANVTEAAMQFDWSANGNADPGTLYRVLVSTAADPLAPAGAVVTTSNTYNTSLNSSGLAADTTYYFRVAGINNNNVATAYTAAQGTATLLAFDPVAGNFTGVGTTAIQFNWLANGNRNPGTLYNVLVSTAPDPFNPDGAVVASSNTYNIYLNSSGLSSDTTYYFTVAGLNKNGVPTNYTAVKATSTLAGIPVFSNFTGVGASAVQFNWTVNGNRDPGTLYRVAVSTAADPLAPAGALATSSDTYNTFLSSAGLKANTTYYFRVAAVNNNNVILGYTGAQSTSTLLAFDPGFGNFTGVTAAAAQFNWAANGNPNPGTQYRVLVSTAADPLVPAGAVVTTSNTYNVYLSSAGLKADTVYNFRVAGVNNNGVLTNYTLAQGTATLLANAPLFSNFTGLGTGSIQFNWTANGNASPGTQYRVYSSTAANPLIPAGAVVSSSDTYNLYLSSAGLNPNTTYYFTVAGINKNLVPTGYTAVQGTSTLAALPSAFDFTGVSSSTIRLDWSASGNGPRAQYRVLISTAANPQAPAGAVVTTSNTYNVYLTTSGITSAKDYYFTAAALNNNGVLTAYSTIVTTKTLAAGSLAAPVAGALVPFSSSMTASWALVGGATGYTLAASVNAGAAPSPIFASSITVGNAVVSASVFSPALTPDTSYYFYVRSNGAGVSSTWSDYAPAYTLLAAPPLFVNFTGVGTTSANFNWALNGNAAGTKFRVLVSTAPDPAAPAGAVVVSSDTYNVSLSSAGLTPDTSYYFRVAGLNKAGVLTAYTAAQATTTWAAAPVFANFTNVGASAIRYNWSAAGNPRTLYRVAVSTAPDPLAPAGAVAVSSDTYNLFLTTAGLAADTTYYFRASAVGNNGSVTAYTAPVGTSTLLAAAPVFSNFTNVGSSAIRFNWAANGNANPGTLYRVAVSTAPDPLNPGGAVASSSYTYNVYLSSSGLAPNATYYFSAAGVNKNGVATAYTAVKGTSTLAELPLSAASTFSAVTNSGFTAAWDAGANPPDTLYLVRISTAQDFNAGAGKQVTASTVPADGPSYAFTGLDFSTLYYFQVSAVNRNGVPTAFAGLGSVQTLALPAPVPDPVDTLDERSITGSWQLVDGATGYTLAASVNPGATPSPVYASSTTAALSAVLAAPPLNLNTTYYLFVRSNGPGESSDWAAYPATSTLANPPVTALSTFSAVTYSGFSVSWGANSNALGTTKYTVEVSSAPDFNGGATDGISFTTAPAAGPGAAFEGLNPDTYYYFRVRANHNNGNFTDWVNLGNRKTLAQPVLHAAGDGVVIYGQAGNTMPQFRNYYGASNTFGSVVPAVAGAAGSLFVIKTNPLSTKQEAVAGYVKNGVLHVLCTDGTNWTEDWTQTVGGNETTRRFDIAYGTNSGDVMVLYSQNAAGTNELGYRTKAGGDECGAANWSGNTNLDPARTSGVVQWVKMASDRRAGFGDLAAIWADANSDLSAMVWNGSSWENEPAAALETSLEVVAAAQDVEDFDVDYESLSGSIMVVWGNSAGANGTNGVRYARATWTGGSPLHTWGTVTTPATFADDATNLALTANPDTNEMIFASLGNAGSDLQAGYWSGTAWTNSGNLDTAAGTPLAGTKLVAAGWLTSGATKRGVVVYQDAATTNIGWYVLSGTVFTVQTDFTPTPAFATPQKRYDIQQDPVNKDRLILTVTDGNSDLFAKRLIMTSAPAFTWTNADGSAALEANLASATVNGTSYAYWPAPPTTSLEQSGFRFFANADSTDVGAPLAPQDTLAVLGGPGTAFRLRSLLHVGQVDLPLNGQGLKLQFAGRGDGTCDAPSNGNPAGYTDVTAATLVAFNNNPAPADNAALTPGADDPQHGAHATVPQTYEEQNNSTNTVSAIARNRDGLWDFSLKDNGMQAGTSYCFRLVKADGAGLSDYGVYPEVMLPSPVVINEVYPAGAAAADDWVELYNNTSSTPSLVGWNLNYVGNSIDLGGGGAPVWTGQAGDVINAYSTFTIAGLAGNLLVAQSHLKLFNNAGALVDLVQWPGPGAVSAGLSFARVTDGDPSFFEIDPTPTPGYANYVGTDTFKINEVGYGRPEEQFIEIFNTSAVSTRTLAGYALRNAASSANGLRFKFTRRIYPRNYTVIDFSSLSDDGKTFSEIFGAQGLAASGDFLALENSTGSAVDLVAWESGNNYFRYNYRGELVSAGNFAPANAARSIGRRPAEGSDTGSDSDDFAESAFATPASRNNGAGLAAGNTLSYPVDTAAPQFLARKFPVTLTLGANSSAGAGNNLVFSRTGGQADPRSPHIYRLQDIGFNLASLARQTTVQTGLAFYDQDGYPLVDSATYRVTLNSDTGAQSAPQIILGTVTYGAAVPGVTGSAAAPRWMNNAARAGVLKLELSNNNPAGFSGLEVATVTFRLLDSALASPLTTAQARNLFNAVMLVRDSDSAGVAGLYEPGIDLSTAAYVPMASLSLDASGLSTLTVSGAGLAAASVPGASTGTFFVVFEATQNASGWSPNVFRVRFAPQTAVTVRDGPSGLQQDFTPSAQVDTSSVTLIAPAQPPAGTSWPYALPAAVVTQAQASYYNNNSDTAVSSAVYMGASDGYLRSVRKDGTVKWSYATSPAAAIHNSPNLVVESGNLYIYFADDNGDVYKLRDDETSAGLVWKQPLGVAIKSNIMCPDLECSGPRIYFGASDNSVRCLNKADGTPCAGWTLAAAITAPVSGTIAIDDRATVNTGWIGLEDGKVVALQTSNGTVPTSYQTGGAIKSSPFLDAHDINPNNVLYFTSTDGKFYARISSNLSSKPAGWAAADYDAGSPINTSPFVTWETPTKYAYFGDDAGKLHKVNAASGVSAAGWPFQAAGAIKSSPIWVPGGSVGLAQDYVYFGCDDGYIYAVDANTGAPRTGWPVATGGPVRADIIIDTDNKRLVAVSGDGKTYVLDVGP